MSSPLDNKTLPYLSIIEASATYRLLESPLRRCQCAHIPITPMTLLVHLATLRSEREAALRLQELRFRVMLYLILVDCSFRG
jgi:hypothetical protein